MTDLKVFRATAVTGRYGDAAINLALVILWWPT